MPWWKIQRPNRIFTTGIWMALGFWPANDCVFSQVAGEADIDKESLISQAARDYVPDTRGICGGNPNTLLYPLNQGAWTRVDFCGDGPSGNRPAVCPDQHNDDDSATVNLPFSFQLYGTNYTQCFVNNNGNISFGGPFSTFSSSGFPLNGFPMIAPFWADVDTGAAATPIGDVWQRFVDSNGDGIFDTYVVTWDNVGYYLEHGDRRNTFQVALSTGNNPTMGIGTNVCFSYDNMCWTTGDASGGVGGFGGTPATVGGNKGDGVNFFQIGRFNENNGNAPAGSPPGTIPGGVDYLDGRRFCFSTATTNNNIPPIPVNFPPGNVLNIVAGDLLSRNLQFQSPEAGQTTTVTIADVDNAVGHGLTFTNVAGNVANVDLSWQTECADAGTYRLNFTASDNFTPPGVTHVTLTINIVAASPFVPAVQINSPTTLAAVCNPTTVTGTASDIAARFQQYALEYSANPNGPWTLINSSTSPVSNGTLGVWNTTGLAQGYYYLRLRANDNCGATAIAFVLAFVDQQFDAVILRRPPIDAIIGGDGYCLDGTVTDYSFASYRVDFAPPPFTTFNPVDPSTPVYTAAVVNDPIASWNTRTGASSVADGTYRIRVTGTDVCGHSATVTRDVTVDNTPPVTIINQPTSCTYVDGVVAVRGTARDTHLAGWTLQYTGGDAHDWVTIASGSTNVVTGLLANWDTTGLRHCAYTLRLVASDEAVLDCNDAAHNASAYEVSVVVGCPGDLNFDGIVSLADLTILLSQFGLSCP